MYELASLIEEQPSLNCRLPKAVAMFQSRACRKSIMIGTPLDSKAMKKVVSKMAKLEHPWSCAHGRPTMHHLVKVWSMDEKPNHPQLEKPKFVNLSERRKSVTFKNSKSSPSILALKRKNADKRRKTLDFHKKEHSEHIGEASNLLKHLSKEATGSSESTFPLDKSVEIVQFDEAVELVRRAYERERNKNARNLEQLNFRLDKIEERVKQLELTKGAKQSKSAIQFEERLDLIEPRVKILEELKSESDDSYD